MSANQDLRARADIVGAAAVWAFSLPGLVLSGLLTVLRLRSDHRCDDTFMGACSGDGVLSCSTVLGDAWATVLGLPLFASPAGLQLGLSLLGEPVRLRDAGAILRHPRNAARAAIDLLRLIRMIAGG